MERANLFPLLVPRVYLELPDAPPDSPPDLARWGIVREIGPDLYRMVISSSDGLIRNVHEEQIEQLGLSVEQAESLALDNLRQVLKSGDQIQMRVIENPNGRGHCVWMGHWLTASCALLPELYQWASTRLKSETVLVSVPERQFLFMFAPGDRAFRDAMCSYIARVVDGMNKGITSDLFVLTRDGLQPHAEVDF